MNKSDIMKAAELLIAKSAEWELSDTEKALIAAAELLKQVEEENKRLLDLLPRNE